MIPEFREILGLDNLDLYYPVKVADFDGECLSFFVRAIDNVEELFKKIQDKVDKLYEEITGEESDQETETGTSQFFADGGNV